uniref:Phosphoprotein n=1 Tax=Rinderpest morbillivirus TaxID=11241 RepID=A0A6M3RK40_9MONO|nr:phosphoprotein [Rinderpest morbillivirus]QJD08810.1 phosphoprotein [Rinderpest morbillivirus]
MAEEQAYHVNKGLECIKALRARPLDPLVVEEALAAWVETSEGQTLDRMSSDEAEADHQDISKPCFPAAGPGKSSMSRCHDQGLGGSNSCDEELGAFIGDSSMHSTEVQHYHVYDHSGEKVEGVEDADSILVQSGADDGVEVWGGDEESENSDVDPGEPDPEGSAPADWGSSPISPATRASDVETVEGDEIQKLLEDQSRIRKMTKAGKTLVVPPIPSQERPTASEKPIKKGTDVKSTSSGTMAESSSTGGATRPALKSQWGPSGPNASAENALASASNVSPTQGSKTESGTTTSRISQSNIEPEDDYDDELFSDIQDIKTALAKLHDDQQIIITRLESLLSLKGEIDSIKKQISKQNISISTIEGHLSSVMIAIPGFGKDPNDPTADVDINPDLRPIIGRDSGRALAEVLKKPASERQSKDTGKLGIESKGLLKKEFQLKPIEKKSSSAIRFVPDGSVASRSVIRSIIKSSHLGEDRKDYLMSLLNDIQGSKDLAQFHQMLVKILKN